jgi:hypothetical protein
MQILKDSEACLIFVTVFSSNIGLRRFALSAGPDSFMLLYLLPVLSPHWTVRCWVRTLNLETDPI